MLLLLILSNINSFECNGNKILLFINRPIINNMAFLYEILLNINAYKKYFYYKLKFRIYIYAYNIS